MHATTNTYAHLNSHEYKLWDGGRELGGGRDA
jgi:hypothetical protein